MKLDIFFARTSRKTSKLKTLLGLTVTRLAVLRNRHHARCAQARGDVAQLLQLGQLDRALLRAEQVIKERNMLDVFVMVEGYCHLIMDRAVLLEHHKECPDELREAVSSLAFASSRSGELPELQDARAVFASMFGKELTAAAVELRSNCGVNLEMIKKLSTRQPSLESRRGVAKEIATEIGIALEFDPPAAPEEAQQPEQNPSPHSFQVPPPTRLDRGENLSMRTRQKYKDAASAAQAAFESAAFAAAAARAAVELSRSESQGRGSGGGAGDQRRKTAEEWSGDKEKRPVVVPNYSWESSAEGDDEDDSSVSSPDSVELPLPGEKEDVFGRAPMNPGGRSGLDLHGQRPIPGSKPVSVRIRRGL